MDLPSRLMEHEAMVNGVFEKRLKGQAQGGIIHGGCRCFQGIRKTIMVADLHDIQVVLSDMQFLFQGYDDTAFAQYTPIEIGQIIHHDGEVIDPVQFCQCAYIIPVSYTHLTLPTILLV